MGTDRDRPLPAATLLAVLVPAGLAGVLVGAIAGGVRWVTIRRYLGECEWVQKSTLGWTVGCVAGLFLMFLPPVISGDSPSVLIVGVCMASGLLLYALLPGVFTASTLVRGPKGSGRSLRDSIPRG